MKDYLLRLAKPRLDTTAFERLRQSPVDFKGATLDQVYECAKALWYASPLYLEAPLWYRHLLSEAQGLLTLQYAILDWEENPFSKSPLGHLEILKQLMHLQANAKEGGLVAALRANDIASYESRLGTLLDDADSRKW